MLLTFRNDVDLWRRRRQSLAVFAYLALLTLLQTVTEATMYEGDSCTMKGVSGVCKLSSECTLLEAAIKRGDFTIEEIERCGFAINEEIICCPIKDFTKPATHEDFWQHLLTTTSTTTVKPDFWEHLISSTAKSTTSRGDFWEGLLPPTTTTAKPDFWLKLLTTTTTPKPLVVGDKELDKDSEFYDFSKLLIGQKKAESIKSNQNSAGAGTRKTDLNTSNAKQPSQPVRNVVQLPREPVSNEVKSRPNRDDEIQKYMQTNHVEEMRPQRARDQITSNHKSLEPHQAQTQSINNNHIRETDRRFHINSNAPQLHVVNNNVARPMEPHGKVLWPDQVRQSSSNQHLTENIWPNQPQRPERSEHALESTRQHATHVSGATNHVIQNQDHRGGGNHDLSGNVGSSHLKPDHGNTITQNQAHRVGSQHDLSEHILANHIQSPASNKHTSDSTWQAPHLEADHNINSQHTQSNIPRHNQQASEFSRPNNIHSLEQVRHASESTRQYVDRESSQNEQHSLHAQEQRTALHNQHSSDTVRANQANGLNRSQNQNNQLTIATSPSTHNKNVDNIFFTGEGLEVWDNSQSHGTPLTKPSGTPTTPSRQQPRNEQQSRIVWPSEGNRATPTLNPVYNSNMDPVEWVNNNLKNLGMNIVKAEERPNGMYVEPTTTRKPIRQQQTPVVQHNRGHADHVDGESNTVNGHLEDAHNSFNREKSTHTPDSRTPTPMPMPTPTPTPTSTSTSTDQTSARPVINRLDERPAVRACRLIDEGLQPSLSPHIIGGTKVELGEFPHMAAIGYSPIAGSDEGPYEFRCGGTLIDKRFVLTAAHCVNSRDAQAVIVRLGVTNFTDPIQMRDVVDIRIKTTHIHPDYSNSRKYNDIALLELERDVPYSDNVYPTCLYMDLNDPPAKEMLYVTGWGVINTSTRQYSDILLKASLQVVSVDRCNVSYIEMGLTRQLSRGVESTQICATDSGFSKDACQGDSGGPLQSILDESYKKYRLVGIVSTGFSCATSTPGLYTRVAAFLDYIEDIVWPTAT